MARLHKGWARVAGGFAVLASLVFGARGTRPLLAQDIYTGKNTEVGGTYACDCRIDNHNCFCIKSS